MKIFENIEDVKAIRKKTGLNQIDFWGKVGVTQSGGSRYETGRKMPKPVRELLRLVHIECIDLAKVNKKDMEIAALLKKHHPDLYAELSKQTKSERKNKVKPQPPDARRFFISEKRKQCRLKHRTGRRIPPAAPASNRRTTRTRLFTNFIQFPVYFRIRRH